MKRLITFVSIVVMGLSVFAQAPELKNIMPNSWEKLARLSEQEEKEFLNQQQVINDIENIKSESWAAPEYIINEKRVYKEIANNVEFYRVLTCNYDMTDFLNAEYKDTSVSKDDYEKYMHQRIQQTIYVKQKGKEISKIWDLEYKVYGIAEGNMETEGCEYFVFYDFLIKELNKNEIGFFITEANIGYKRHTEPNKFYIEYAKTKNQKAGRSKCEFRCVKNKEDFVKAFSDKARRVRIDASDFLFDSKCPLKYSIQNAFDGNPATSYVENTEDDLIRIAISAEGVFDKVRLINGYAKNKELYYSNNRIKTVSSEFDSESEDMVEWGQKLTDKNERFPVQDGILTNQIVNYFTNGYFFVSDVYKGESFNDTCLAELDFCKKDGNWIFGDINE